MEITIICPRWQEFNEYLDNRHYPRIEKAGVVLQYGVVFSIVNPDGYIAEYQAWEKSASTRTEENQK